jgi:hypothetical protein
MESSCIKDGFYATALQTACQKAIAASRTLPWLPSEWGIQGWLITRKGCAHHSRLIANPSVTLQEADKSISIVMDPQGTV